MSSGPRDNRRALLRALPLLGVIAACASSAFGATSSTVVGATVPTSTSIDLSGCAASSMLSLGPMTGGTTSIAGSACRVQFGSNAAARLALYQRDGDGAAMTQARPVLDTRSGVPSYRAADLLDANDMWVAGTRVNVGDPVPLKHTVDGGANWTDVTACAAFTSSISNVLAWSATEVLTFSGNRACRSTDTGATWSTITLPLSIGSRVMNAPGTDVVWATASGSGRLLRSTDRGVTWSTVVTPATTGHSTVVGWGTLNAVAVNTVTAGDGLSRTAYAWRTSDGGVTWTQSTVATIPVTTIPATTGSLSHLDRSSVSGRLVAIGSWALGTRFKQYYSDDGGATWAELPLPPFTDQLRYVSGSTWVGGNRMNTASVSTDDGLTWVSRSMGGGSTAFFNFVTAERGGSIVVVGDGASVYRSADQGTTWSSVAPVYASYDAVVAFDSQRLAVIGADGVALRSSDAGVTMVAASGCGGSNFRDAVATGPSSAVAVGASGKICRTTDAGATWTNVASPTSAWLTGLERAPATGMLLAHGSSTTSFITSTDDGGSWQLMNLSVAGSVSRVAMDERGETIAASRASGGQLWVSTDSGVTWTARDTGIASTLQSLAVSPSGGRIVVGHYPTPDDNMNKLAVSTDDGATWSAAPVNGGSGELVDSRFTSDERLWVIAGTRTMVSDDGGLTFTGQGTSGGKPSELEVVDANTVIVSGIGKLLAVSRPVTWIPDVVPGTGLTPASGAFGACLLATTATAGWPTIGSCPSANTAVWRPVPATAADPNALVASITNGSATADLLFGQRIPATQASGSYLAHVVYDVAAP